MKQLTLFSPIKSLAKRAAKRVAAGALEGAADFLDRTRERIVPPRINGHHAPPGLIMAQGPPRPSDLPKGAWGGQALQKSQEQVHLEMQQNRQIAAIATQHEASILSQKLEKAIEEGSIPEEKIERLRQAARAKAEAAAKIPKPVYHKPDRSKLGGGDMVSAMAEEGIRHQLSMGKSVVVDDASELNIPGLAKGFRGNAVVRGAEPQQQQQAPGLIMAGQEAPRQSSLAARKAAPAPGGASLAQYAAAISKATELVEDGHGDANELVALLTAAAELQYAIAGRLK